MGVITPYQSRILCIVEFIESCFLLIMLVNFYIVNDAKVLCYKLTVVSFGVFTH